MTTTNGAPLAASIGRGNRWLGIFALLPIGVLLVGCPICADGELEVVQGTLPLASGQTVALRFEWDGEVLYSPQKCGGHWYVEEILGGNEEVGTISVCGSYTAPDILSASDPVVTASQYALDTCHDCCPYAQLTIALER